MDSATNVVVGKGLHLHLLENDALTSHSGIAVHDNGDDSCAVLRGAAKGMLLGANATHNNRVDSFQVRRVSQEGDSDIDLGTVRLSLIPDHTSAQVVLDITSVGVLGLNLVVWQDSLELGHNDFHRLAHNISQHIEAASVWHTNNELARAVLDSGIDRHLKARDKAFTAFKAEALHRVELLSQE